jgi:hypothetical protein
MAVHVIRSGLQDSRAESEGPPSPVGILRSIGLFLNFCAIGIIRVLTNGSSFDPLRITRWRGRERRTPFSRGDPPLYWTLLELLCHRHYSCSDKWQFM